MSNVVTLAIVSDIHYASAAEQSRGRDYQLQGITSPLSRFFLKAYRRFIWLRNPFGQNHLLDKFLNQAGAADFVVANGDFSCDSISIGVSDDASCESARECLAKLRQKFGARFQATIGDHELGKLSFVAGQGGMRLASFHRARTELGLEPFWKKEIGNYVLMGVASSLVALPVFEQDILPGEKIQWQQLRAGHLAEIRAAFLALKREQRVILFCHDPTALPFLWRDDAIQKKLPQVEQTIIGHLHTNLVFWKSRMLAGMPPIGFLGSSVKRMSTALSEARVWKAFRTRLCPALAGIELLKDGGYYSVELDVHGHAPARFHFHSIGR